MSKALSIQNNHHTNNALQTSIAHYRYIPLYTVFLVVCDMWKEVPPEAKGGFGLSSGNTQAENLRILNILYDDDNAKTKEFNARIKSTKDELKECEAKMLKLDKLKRRIERKWNNGVASADELMTLQNTRVEITEAQADKTYVNIGELQRSIALYYCYYISNVKFYK